MTETFGLYGFREMREDNERNLRASLVRRAARKGVHIGAVTQTELMLATGMTLLASHATFV